MDNRGVRLETLAHEDRRQRTRRPRLWDGHRRTSPGGDRVMGLHLTLTAAWAHQPLAEGNVSTTHASIVVLWGHVHFALILCTTCCW
jgi:hypothetical protein